MKSNYILIGMPGAGKSTIGVILAKILGLEFVDTDLVIQKAEGKLLKEIIEQEGTDGFVSRENQIISNLKVSRSVIATGGSVVYGQEAMRSLSETGTIIYLKQDLDEIQKRLHNIHNRGVVLRENQTIEELFRERCPLYEQYADIVVDEAGLDIEETLEAVLNSISV